MIFLLMLFGVFVISTLFVVLFGAKIYKNTAQTMEANYSMRTVSSYVTEKVHNSGSSSVMSVENRNDTDMFCISIKEGDRLYHTYLYFYDGYLNEITVEDGFDFSNDFGQKIIPLEGFHMEQKADNLMFFTANDEHNQTIEFFVSVPAFQTEN